VIFSVLRFSMRAMADRISSWSMCVHCPRISTSEDFISARAWSSSRETRSEPMAAVMLKSSSASRENVEGVSVSGAVTLAYSATRRFAPWRDHQEG
jgi:hypothetical protein